MLLIAYYAENYAGIIDSSLFYTEEHDCNVAYGAWSPSSGLPRALLGESIRLYA